MKIDSKKTAKSKANRQGRIQSALTDPLRRIESAAADDITVARVALGFLDCLAGRYQASPFPGYRGCLLDVRQFPHKLKKDARLLVDWALMPAQHDIFEVYRSSRNIEKAVIRMRRESTLGRRMRHRAGRLMRIYPPIEQGKWGPFGTVFDLLPDECGKPLTERVVTLAQAFKPAMLQIVPRDHSMNGEWTVGVLTIRLSEDRYTVDKVTLALELPNQAALSESSRFEGELIDYFETGSEGVVWMIEDERRHGREALEMICEGDHLTIEDQLGRMRWKGIISCDKKTGWQRYPLNPEYGQQCALGHWVHWIQRGFTPDDWARFFIRPDYDRLHGILVKRGRGKRDPRLGPDPGGR